MNKKIISIAILSILIVALVGFLVFAGPKTGDSILPGTNPLNIFNGKITNAKVSPGKIIGFTSYDANCVGTQEQTQCDAGITTEQYGELNFHYQHNMVTQPCLHMYGSEKVILDVLDSDGNAEITRTIDTSNMGMHHG